MLQRKEANIVEILGSELHRTASEGKEIVAGMYQWALGDLKVLPKYSFEQLAIMLILIKKGKPWPKQYKHARAAFLSREEEEEMEALGYRVLLMLPSV